MLKILIDITSFISSAVIYTCTYVFDKNHHDTYQLFQDIYFTAILAKPDFHISIAYCCHFYVAIATNSSAIIQWAGANPAKQKLGLEYIECFD
jgi:hypothetical protein